jgi:hypothetical protein
MNLFYRIHLQAFNVISIVLYHSGPMFGQVLYSCQDAFVVDASDYSGHFPTEWFFLILGTRESLVGSCQDCTAGGEALAIHTFPKFPILHLRHEAAGYRSWLQSVSSSISRLRFAEQGPRSLWYRTQCSLLKAGSQLLRKSERLHHPTGHASAVCRTFEMTYVILSINRHSVIPWLFYSRLTLHRVLPVWNLLVPTLFLLFFDFEFYNVRPN